jgi:thymidine phosphorylase
MFLTTEIIRKKRDKKELTKAEIEFFVKGVTDNSVSSEQISAFTMAVFFNNLNMEERKNLTLAMRDSGEVIKFEGMEDYPIVDKHSTGGVADLVSLPLAPIVAACGGFVPMISGKGLGHTGGTTDKMNSILGYSTIPNNDLFKKVVKEIGCAIIGQTANLAPADKRIYAVRDTTATVESSALIAASILSKKLASGIKSLVMDIKVGSGAFMDTPEKAQELAETIVSIASSVGTPTTAFITDMNEALGRNIGNTLEVVETVEYLTGKNIDAKLDAITKELAIEMLLLSKISKNKEEATNKINAVLKNGLAAEKFEKMVSALGGPKDILTSYNNGVVLQKSKFVKPIFLKNSGVITKIDNRQLGLCLVHLGGGRKTATDTLDYTVGLTNVAKVGESVDNQKPFAVLHYNNESHFSLISDILNNIVSLGTKADKLPAIYKIIRS